MPKGRGFDAPEGLSRPAPGGRRSTKRESTDVSTAEHAEVNRRDFLYIATGAVGGVGAALAAWPFINQMNPDASVLAHGLGRGRSGAHRRGPGNHHQVARQSGVRPPPHRTRKSRPPRRWRSSELTDPLARNANVPDGDPATDVNRVVGGKEKYHRHDGRLHPSGLRADPATRATSRSSKAMPRSAAGSAPATARTTIPPAASAKAPRRRTWRCRSTATSPTPRSASAKKDNPHERTFELSSPRAPSESGSMSACRSWTSFRARRWISRRRRT